MKLNKVMIRTGPPLYAEEHVKKFKAKHKNVFVKNKRIYAKMKRIYRDGKSLVKDLLKDSYTKEKITKAEIL